MSSRTISERAYFNKEFFRVLVDHLPLTYDMSLEKINRVLTSLDNDTFQFIQTIYLSSVDQDRKKKENMPLTIPDFIDYSYEHFKSKQTSEVLFYNMINFSLYIKLDEKTINISSFRKIFKNIDTKSGLSRSVSRVPIIKKIISEFIYCMVNIIKYKLISIYNGVRSIDYIELAFHILLSFGVEELYNGGIVPSVFIKPKDYFDELYGTY